MKVRRSRRSAPAEKVDGWDDAIINARVPAPTFGGGAPLEEEEGER